MKGGEGHGWDDVDLSNPHKINQFITQCGYDTGSIDVQAKVVLTPRLLNTKPLQLQIMESPGASVALKEKMREKILAVINSTSKGAFGPIFDAVVKLNVNGTLEDLKQEEKKIFLKIMVPPELICNEGCIPDPAYTGPPLPEGWTMDDTHYYPVKIKRLPDPNHHVIRYNFR